MKKIVEIIRVIFSFSFIGTTFALAVDWGLTRQFPAWFVLVLLFGNIVTLNLISSYFYKSDIKLFGKLNIVLIGLIAYIFSACWVILSF